MRHARKRQCDRFIVAVSRTLVDNRSARISQPKQPCDLIVRLPRCIVARPPDALVRARLVHQIEAGMTARHHERHERQRQVAVLRLMADGLGNASIARSLSCSEHTIKNVIYELMTRLDARNRAHAVAAAVRAGLI